jgi:hypothetical protein
MKKDKALKEKILKDVLIASKYNETEEKHEKIQMEAYRKKVNIFKRMNTLLQEAGYSQGDKVKIGENIFEVGREGSCGSREKIEEL